MELKKFLNRGITDTRCATSFCDNFGGFWKHDAISHFHRFAITVIDIAANACRILYARSDTVKLRLKNRKQCILRGLAEKSRRPRRSWSPETKVFHSLPSKKKYAWKFDIGGIDTRVYVRWINSQRSEMKLEPLNRSFERALAAGHGPGQ